MPERTDRFDAELAREQWDRAAEAYAHAQRTGEDYYRSEFFGPAQVELCGEVDGLRVLDLGCGSGYFSRELARRGASVVGVDLSPEMIARAKEEGGEGIDFHVMDAVEIGSAFPAASFDLVTACVSLQDMTEPERILRAAHVVLRPGGRALVCLAHPCTDTPYREWHRDERGNKLSLGISDYFYRGPVTYRWTNPRYLYSWTTTALHVPLADWVRWLLDAGFTIEGLHEPRPTEEAVARRPGLEDARMVPYFVILDGRK